MGISCVKHFKEVLTGSQAAHKVSSISNDLSDVIIKNNLLKAERYQEGIKRIKNRVLNNNESYILHNPNQVTGSGATAVVNDIKEEDQNLENLENLEHLENLADRPAKAGQSDTDMNLERLSFYRSKDVGLHLSPDDNETLKDNSRKGGSFSNDIFTVQHRRESTPASSGIKETYENKDATEIRKALLTDYRRNSTDSVKRQNVLDRRKASLDQFFNDYVVKSKHEEKLVKELRRYRKRRNSKFTGGDKSLRRVSLI